MFVMKRWNMLASEESQELVVGRKEYLRTQPLGVSERVEVGVVEAAVGEGERDARSLEMFQSDKPLV
jgi:hypothetical protein